MSNIQYNKVGFTKNGEVIKKTLPTKIGEYLVIMPDDINSVAIIKVRHLIKEHWDMMKYKAWYLDIEY